jgi:hypothetical protein
MNLLVGAGPFHVLDIRFTGQAVMNRTYDFPTLELGLGRELLLVPMTFPLLLALLARHLADRWGTV